MAMDREMAQSTLDLVDAGKMELPTQTLANMRAFVSSDDKDTKSFQQYHSKYGDASLPTSASDAAKAAEQAQVAAGINPWDAIGKFDAAGNKISGPPPAPYAVPGDPGYQPPVAPPKPVMAPPSAPAPQVPATTTVNVPGVVGRPDLRDPRIAPQGALASDMSGASNAPRGPAPAGMPRMGGAPASNPNDLPFAKDDMGYYQTDQGKGTQQQYLKATLYNAKLANDNIKDAGIDQKLAIQNTSDAEIQAAEKRASLQQIEAVKMDQLEKERQVKEVDRQARVQTAYQDYQNAVNDYSKQKIDPNHFMNSQSVAQRIILAIGLMAGGGAAGLRGGPNTAAQFLNAQIDRDIDAQKAEMAKAGNITNMKHNIYGDMLAMTGDERAADMLTKKIYQENMAQKIAAEGAKYDSPIMQAKTQQVLAGLNQQAAQNDAHFRLWLDQTSMAAHAPRGTGVINNGADVIKPEAVGEVNGKPYDFGDKETRDKNLTIIQKSDEAIEALKRTKEILQDKAYANSPKGRAELDTLANNYALAYGPSQTGSTRVNETEINAGHNIIGGGEWIRGDFTGSRTSALDTQIKQAEQRKKEAMDAAIPVKTGLVQEKANSTKLTRGARYLRPGEQSQEPSGPAPVKVRPND